MNYNTKAWTTLRLIAFFPSAFLACIIAYWGFHYVYSTFLDDSTWLVRYFIPLACSFFSGVAFMYVGIGIAPSYREIVGRILLGIALLISGAAIYLQLSDRE